MPLRQMDWVRWYHGTTATVSHIERAYSPSRFLDTLRQYLPHWAGARVLELGCAPGRWLAWAALRLGVQPVGVDMDPQGVRLSRALYSHVPVVQGDAFHLPFRLGSFNAVYSIGLIEHFDDPSEIVREAHRVLKPGGISVWLVPNLEAGSIARWHWRTFRRANFEAHRVLTLSDLRGLLERNGFQVIASEYSGLYIPHFQWALGRLPIRSWLRRVERPKLSTNLVVVGRWQRSDTRTPAE